MRQGRFGQNKSAAFWQAVDLLVGLDQEGRTDVAGDAHAEATWQRKRDDWAAQWGLVESDMPWCAQRLLGKACAAGRRGQVCVCEPPGVDHPTLWSRAGEPAVYVFQPYGLSWNALQKLVAFGKSQGLEVRINAAPAWHYPGSVLMVEILAPDEAAYRLSARSSRRAIRPNWQQN